VEATRPIINKNLLFRLISTISNKQKITMKLIPSILLFLTTSLLFVQSFSQTRITNNIDSLLCPLGYASVGHPYVKFKLTNDKKTIDNQSINGRVVFINFWFEGCHPCLAEMDALNKLFEKMKDNEDFVFISITWDNQETIKRVKEKYSLSFDIFTASPKECQALNYNCAYPTNIVLDKTGVLRYMYNGGSLDKTEADKFVMTTLLTKIHSLL
jgi:peroxiredoxin